MLIRAVLAASACVLVGSMPLAQPAGSGGGAGEGYGDSAETRARSKPEREPLPEVAEGEPIHAAPAAAMPERVTTIAFGSCLRQDRPAPILSVIAGQGPNVFVWLGDNIYGDTEDMGVLRRKYQQLARQEGFRALWAACPQLAVWDDHDYGQNDAGLEYPQREASRRLFGEFWGLAEDSPVRREQDGIYRSVAAGPVGERVQFILLDTRYNRTALEKRETWRGLPGAEEYPGPYSARDSEGSTFLGEAQWAWLRERLLEPADVRIIATSIQFVAEEARFERWANFPSERLRMIRLIRETGARGVIFLSGDRHRGEISVLEPGRATVSPPTPETPKPVHAGPEDQPPYPLWDVTASALNQGTRPESKEVNTHRRGPLIGSENYGWIEIGWGMDGVPIRLQLRGSDGGVLSESVVRLNALRAE